MKYRLKHVGIAVNDAAKSAGLFGRLLNAHVSHEEAVPDQKVRTMFIDTGASGLELLEPTSPDSPVAKFLRIRGEGVHHLSFEVDDIEAELVRLRTAGFRLVDEFPRIGAGGDRIAFLHPKSTGGVLVEISQKKK